MGGGVAVGIVGGRYSGGRYLEALVSQEIDILGLPIPLKIATPPLWYWHLVVATKTGTVDKRVVRILLEWFLVHSVILITDYPVCPHDCTGWQGLGRDQFCDDWRRLTPGVTEYFDPPENPGPGPNFTEKVGPLRQKTFYFLLKY